MSEGLSGTQVRPFVLILINHLMSFISLCVEREREKQLAKAVNK